MLFWKSARKVTFVCSSSKGELSSSTVPANSAAKILRRLEPKNGIEVDVRVRAPKDESTASAHNLE